MSIPLVLKNSHFFEELMLCFWNVTMVNIGYFRSEEFAVDIVIKKRFNYSSFDRLITRVCQKFK